MEEAEARGAGEDQENPGGRCVQVERGTADDPEAVVQR